ncbi:MAG: NAD(P)/FAD-dependent oxidoreductase [Desulfobacterales bacterium]|jgi:thioredoxin reductase (NADPH)|nr:NAD(P)/FAD-dependent oxidoreductase [Desulfobacterales bacterium]
MPDKSYDVVILGTGPAGLQAAIHAARRKASVLVLGKETRSSIFHHHVENYCCVFDTTGEDIIKTGRRQAESFGTELRDEDVLAIAQEGPRFKLSLEGGDTVSAATVVIATGTARKRLGVPGEKELLGRGVSYCVECDCNFYKGQDVAVIGTGSAAASGALTMLNYARRVHLVYDRLEVAPALEAELRKSAVQLHEGAKVTAISGAEAVEALALQDGSRLPVQGVFVELGAKGVMELAGLLGVQLDDEMKHIQTNKKMETSVPGIYAAGDITGPPWQVAKAVGEGCVAGLEAAAYAKKMKKD